MKYQNEYHRTTEQQKMKKIAEWQKHPANLKDVLKRQRRREQLADEMENKTREKENPELLDPDNEKM